MDRVVELRGVADHDPAVAAELRHRLVAAFGDEMGGVFLHFRAFQQRLDRRMRLERLEQRRRASRRLREIGHQAADADREAFLVGVDEAHAGHAARDRAHGLDDDALVALHIEARLDRLGGKEMHFLDGERDMIGFGRLAKAGAAAEQSVDAFGEHDDVGVDDPVLAVGAHADARAIGVEDRVRARSSRSAPARPPRGPCARTICRTASEGSCSGSAWLR